MNRKLIVGAIAVGAVSAALTSCGRSPSPPAALVHNPSPPALSQPTNGGLVGHWKGLTYEEGAPPATVEFDVPITRATAGSTLGKLTLVDNTGTCLYDTKVTRSSANSIKFSTISVSGSDPSCGGGEVTLTRRSDGSGDFGWTDSEGTSTGILSRS